MDQRINDILSQFMAECTATEKSEDSKQPQEIDKDGGTYVEVKFHPETVKNLQFYQAYLAQALNINPDDLVDPTEFHSTVVYSRKSLPDFEAQSYAPPIEVEPKRRSYKLALFGKDKDTLVLTYRCKELQRRFDEARTMGATFDFPEYTPHITFCYKVPGKVAKQGAKLLRELHVPTFSLLIVKEKKSKIDEDYSSKASKGAKDDDNKETTASAVELSSLESNLVPFFNPRHTSGRVFPADSDKDVPEADLPVIARLTRYFHSDLMAAE